MRPGPFPHQLSPPRPIIRPEVLAGLSAQPPISPGGAKNTRTFGQVLAGALITRQSQPLPLGGRRQDWPRPCGRLATGDARLSGLLLHSVLSLSQGRGAACAPTAGHARLPSGSEIERHFRGGYARPGRSWGDSSAYDHLIKEAARRHQVPEGLIKAVISVESNFDPRATSPAGAMGLMQLMPGTARDLGVRCAYNPKENIDGGTRYLRDLLDRYGGNVPMALAAYNWGPGNLERGGSLPRETRKYLASVGQLYPIRQLSQAALRKNPPPVPHLGQAGAGTCQQT